MTTKEVVLEILAQLPDDCSWDDVQYQIYVRRAVQEGLDSEQRGELHSLDEVRRLMTQ